MDRGWAEELGRLLHLNWWCWHKPALVPPTKRKWDWASYAWTISIPPVTDSPAQIFCKASFVSFRTYWQMSALRMICFSFLVSGPQSCFVHSTSLSSQNSTRGMQTILFWNPGGRSKPGKKQEASNTPGQQNQKHPLRLLDSCLCHLQFSFWKIALVRFTNKDFPWSDFVLQASSCKKGASSAFSSQCQVSALPTQNILVRNHLKIQQPPTNVLSLLLPVLLSITPQKRKMENKKEWQYEVLLQVAVWYWENPAQPLSFSLPPPLFYCSHLLK